MSRFEGLPQSWVPSLSRATPAIHRINSPNVRCLLLDNGGKQSRTVISPLPMVNTKCHRQVILACFFWAQGLGREKEIPRLSVHPSDRLNRGTERPRNPGVFGSGLTFRKLFLSLGAADSWQFERIRTTGEKYVRRSDRTDIYPSATCSSAWIREESCPREEIFLYRLAPSAFSFEAEGKSFACVQARRRVQNPYLPTAVTASVLKLKPGCIPTEVVGRFNFQILPESEPPPHYSIASFQLSARNQVGLLQAERRHPKLQEAQGWSSAVKVKCTCGGGGDEVFDSECGSRVPGAYRRSGDPFVSRASQLAASACVRPPRNNGPLHNWSGFMWPASASASGQIDIDVLVLAMATPRLGRGSCATTLTDCGVDEGDQNLEQASAPRNLLYSVIRREVEFVAYLRFSPFMNPPPPPPLRGSANAELG
ncbi:hypothetical protein DFH06DRAFT_1123210 [Mycena polygramma]|nr:hypothetical protein DFH06DRAFT_1123210 [Mycena polygramma]